MRRDAADDVLGDDAADADHVFFTNSGAEARLTPKPATIRSPLRSSMTRHFRKSAADVISMLMLAGILIGSLVTLWLGDAAVELAHRQGQEPEGPGLQGGLDLAVLEEALHE